MSREVSMQADVGGLSMRGLGAFTTVLATLSADNLVPMALIQMENLGTKFLVSGAFAENVKDLLQRCKDVRLDRLALSIGWRKNDSASLMAESAGGQAIALLSMCLRNYFKHEDTGLVLSRLCSRLCPHSANVSSAAQLADVADLLAGKVQALGFGNLLAKEATRICEIYNTLGQTAPSDILDCLNVESMVDFLTQISQALCQEDKICRIVGHYGMGHIMGLVQALFCKNVTIVVEGIVIQDVEQAKIRCEIFEPASNELTRIQLETIISNAQEIQLPVEHRKITQDGVDPGMLFTFKWPGWLADHIRVIFMNYGFICHQNVIQAYANLLVTLPASIKIEKTVTEFGDRRSKPILLESLATLLGPSPRARMSLICEQILACTPMDIHNNPSIALLNFVETVKQQANTIKCQCPKDLEPHAWSQGWPYHDDRRVRKHRNECENYQFWLSLGYALIHGLHCFFIDAGTNATIRPEYGAFYQEI